MTLLFVYLTLAIVVSFFCSIAEAVLLSVRPSYVKAMELRKSKSAQRIKKLRDYLDNHKIAALPAVFDCQKCQSHHSLDC